MKELTKEDKARRYDEVSKEVKDFFEGRRKMQSDVTQTLEYLFPELIETDDEKIRKKLLKMFKDMERDETTLDDYGLDKLKTITWLEKQESVEEIVERSKTSWFNAGKIQGKMEGLSDEEKYQQGWHDAIEKQGVQKSKNESTDTCNSLIIKAKEFPASEKRDFGYFSETAAKVEPKFKVGDWVVRKDGGFFINDIKFAQITEIDGEKHWFDTGLICLKAEDMRLWTLEDAEDGDILYSKKHNLLWRYKNTKECYCCINLNYNSNNISIGDVMVIPNDVRPATKEQCDLLFDKMLQHTFSKVNGKKELKFHEGDWVIARGEVILICDIRNDLYDVMFADGEHRVYDTNILDKEAHLWTIDDAKDGDILISWTNKPFIYNGFFNETYVGAYCGLNTFNRIIIADTQGYLHHNWTINKDIRPATKEQRDLLFDKMLQQGQHNPTDNGNKIEPKFHEGDWVIGVATEFKPRQIVEVLTSGYKTSNDGWIGLSFECGMHLWTIADAKDGDVLVASDGSIFIFAGVVDYTCKYYAALTLYNGLSINKEVELGSWELANHVHPATKEQCDLLFAKMSEKGYKFNNEKKEIIRRI